MKPQRPLDIRIDRLAFTALPHGGEERLKAAVEAELKKLIAGHSPPPSRFGANPQRGRPTHTALQTSARQIALTIYRSLGTS